ncbi:MAG TPA: hypothetical protein VGB39_05330 [Sphingomicrobium sp.]
MSRFEHDFKAADEGAPGAVQSDQRDAIACYLSAGAGWNDALKALHGAFASEAAATPSQPGKAQHEHEINHRASEYLQWPGLKNSETDND